MAPYEPEVDQLRAVLGSPSWYPPCEEGQISNKFESCNTNGIPLGRDGKVYYFVIGADQLGRDLLSRIIYGARLSLSLAAIAITIGTLFGTTVGLIAGYYGGFTDEVIMRVVDVFNAIPYILLAIALVFVLGQSFAVVAGVLALGSWAGIARLVRGQTLQVRNFDYIALATIAGASHIPNYAAPSPPCRCQHGSSRQVRFRWEAPYWRRAFCPSWAQACLLRHLLGGRILPMVGNILGSAWWVAFFPGMAIFLTVLSFNFNRRLAARSLGSAVCARFSRYIYHRCAQ